MATANTVDTLDGNFKQVYGEMKDLIPEGYHLLTEIPFSGREKQLGAYFHECIVLANEQGWTFNNGDGSAFNLNSSVASVTKDAQVRGTEMVLRSALSYGAASRSLGGGQRAFKDATKYLVQNMMKSASKVLEVEMLYGQKGLGSVASVAGNVITITTAAWATGIWIGAENMPIEIRDSAGTTLRGQATVTSIDIDLRTVTVDVLPGGTTATDIIWRKGAYSNEFAGMQKIITNTGSLFGIDASAYNLWKGNTFTPGSESVLSFTIIQQAITKAVNKGLEGPVMVLCNPGHWDDLLTEQAALRMYDSSYRSSETENGSESIKFHGQNGRIEVRPSIYVKEGHAFVLSMDELVRVGSTDVTFKRPGEGDKFFKELENSAGYELRLYSDQALFTNAPGHHTLITNLKIA